jgi:uncharacterized damage-inducible protein DinB
MKVYFLKLFDYDLTMNLALIDMIRSANIGEEPLRLMSHLLVSQQIWLSRCQFDPMARDAQWPDWPADSLKVIAEHNNADWVNFLESQSPDDFDQIITYKNSKGMAFSNPLQEVLAHLVNHGTHHRAQTGIYLKQAGIQLPPTDYIFYLRQRQ